jgi:hypothetical protein
MSYVVGIGHRSGHGKDTLANYVVHFLREMLPEKRVVKRSWAWKLKDISYQLYAHLGLQPGEFYETDEGRKLRNIKLPLIDLTPVEIWIRIGSRAIRDKVWDFTWVEWHKNNTAADIVITADTRFPLEIPYCDLTVLCTNPRVQNREGESVDDELAHFHDWNYQIFNRGSIADLGNKALKLSYSIRDNYNK